MVGETVVRDGRWEALLHRLAGLEDRPRPPVAAGRARDPVATVRVGLRYLRLLGAAPWTATAMAGCFVVAALAPLGCAVIASALVADLLAGRSAGSTGLVVSFGAVLLAGSVAQVASRVLDRQLVRRIDGDARREVRRMILGPSGLRHLENPETLDEIRRVTDDGMETGESERTLGTGATAQLQAVFKYTTAIIAAAVIAGYSVPLAIGLLALALLMRAVSRRQWMALSDVADTHAEGERQVTYWEDTVATRPDAEDVRLFGLADWALDHRRRDFEGMVQEIWSIRRLVLRSQGRTATIALAAAALMLGWLGVTALRDAITIEQLVLLLGAGWALLGACAMGPEVFHIAYGQASLAAYERIGALAAPETDDRVATDRASSVHLRKVGFGYAGARRKVIEDLDLEIAAGEVVALVGRNGAGKTTLIKLLCGLYAPDAGTVHVGESGVDRVAALFQDFVHYPASVRDNVALGAPAANPADVTGALRRAGAATVVAGLPQGVETMLSRSVDDSLDLSGGQWQRLALARALFAVGHGCGLLVLDEPTSHLDVAAEAAFYDEIVRGVDRRATVLLISHRLATVRHADRIVLLEGGRIVESGDHESLLAADGGYARMFRLQAARFAEEVNP